MLDFTRIVKFSRNFRYFSAAVLESNFHKGPWNILYFGTDLFAVKPLDSLNRCLIGCICILISKFSCKCIYMCGWG